MQSLTTHLQTFIAAHGLEAIFVLMVLESACIPIPSEVTMIYAGYLVSQGGLGFWQAVLVGAFANLVGSWIAWAAGAYGVDSVILRTEHNRRRVDQAHRWFERYGSPVVFFARMVPRGAHVHLAAGRGGADAARPVLGADLPGLAAVVHRCWSAIGDVAGANWDTWHHRFGYLDYVVVAAAMAARGLVATATRRQAAV